MPTPFRNIFAITLFIVLTSNLTKAQSDNETFVDISVGYGLSYPYDESDISGSGFYASGEYVIKYSKWFSIRPYAGVLFTSTNNNATEEELLDYKVTSNAFLIGGKARVTIPIAWVAPYFEIGLGASIGTFETYTPYTIKKEKGGLMHIPVSLGLALGPKHNFEIAFCYYFHPSVEQFGGAAAIGFTFPIND